MTESEIQKGDKGELQRKLDAGLLSLLAHVQERAVGKGASGRVAGGRSTCKGTWSSHSCQTDDVFHPIEEFG